MSGFISRFAFFIDFLPQFYRVLFEAEVMELAQLSAPAEAFENSKFCPSCELEYQTFEKIGFDKLSAHITWK